MIVARYGTRSAFGGVYAELDDGTVVNVSWLRFDGEWVDPPEGYVTEDPWAWHWAPGMGPAQRLGWV